VGRIVVDASLALHWLFDEGRQRQALGLLTQWRATQTARIVPPLFASEIATGILRRRRQEVVTATEAAQLFRLAMGMVSVQAHDGPLTLRAMQIADDLGQRNAYDSLYLALAVRESCELWTADTRLFNLARGRFVFVHMLEGA
jgi:predicted nucleic acid-binding protein